MDLITPELRSALATQFPLGSQENRGYRAKVLVKFSSAAGRYTFLATEAKERRGDIVFFGFSVSPRGPNCDEWAFVTLSELERTRFRGVPVERDPYLPFATLTVADLLASLSKSA
jgi:hypothetical protein